MPGIDASARSDSRACEIFTNLKQNIDTYLIFVIFFTQARFLENKIYTEERVNYDKWILRQNSVNRDLLGQANYKDQDYTKFVTHCVENYTPSVKAHSVCVKINMTQSLSNYTPCVKLHTEYKSCVSFV